MPHKNLQAPVLRSRQVWRGRSLRLLQTGIRWRAPRPPTAPRRYRVLNIESIDRRHGSVDGKVERGRGLVKLDAVPRIEQQSYRTHRGSDEETKTPAWEISVVFRIVQERDPSGRGRRRHQALRPHRRRTSASLVRWPIPELTGKTIYRFASRKCGGASSDARRHVAEPRSLPL